MKTEFVQEQGEMHWSDGWHFKRLDDGSVRLRDFTTNHIAVIPAPEWVSLIHHLGKDQTAEAFQRATEFHRG